MSLFAAPGQALSPSPVVSQTQSRRQRLHGGSTTWSLVEGQGVLHPTIKIFYRIFDPQTRVPGKSMISRKNQVNITDIDGNRLPKSPYRLWLRAD